MKPLVKLRVGSHDFAKQPSIHAVGKGRQAYLWIGNDARDDMRCYATLGGIKTLRKLANNILRLTTLIRAKRASKPVSA